MPLKQGDRLGPYDIAELLGSGGMGEVYRARDSRSGDEVAIKMLRESLASDPRFRERFEREARTVSQLEHPHLCAVHDVGVERGTPYLVMELLDGVTLADRLSEGPLAVSEVLRIGREIADATEAAHERTCHFGHLQSPMSEASVVQRIAPGRCETPLPLRGPWGARLARAAIEAFTYVVG